MLKRVREFAAAHSLEVSELQDAVVVRIVKPGTVVEATIPATVLEWHATARSPAGTKIWSDWVDYYRTSSETDAQLREDMLSDIERFLTTLVSSEIRVSGSELEWKLHGDWKPISVAAV